MYEKKCFHVGEREYVTVEKILIEKGHSRTDWDIQMERWYYVLIKNVV